MSALKKHHALVLPCHSVVGYDGMHVLCTEGLGYARVH